MRFLFLFTYFVTSSVYGGLDRLSIQNLNLNYNNPYGKGEVEKISIDFSTKKQTMGTYPVEVHRHDENFQLVSPFIDVIWDKPWSFLHNMQGLLVEGGSAVMGTQNHEAVLQKMVITPKKNEGSYHFNKVSVTCKGKSRQMRFENRLLDDCQEKLEVKVDTLDVPVDFFMAKILDEYPQDPMGEEDRPADGLRLTSYKGEFNLVVYTRIIFYAGLRAWGKVAFEDDYKTIIIKISQIRFGYLPITSRVMKELRNRIKHPDVSINGNEIRIKLP